MYCIEIVDVLYVLELQSVVCHKYYCIVVCLCGPGSIIQYLWSLYGWSHSSNYLVQSAGPTLPHNLQSCWVCWVWISPIQDASFLDNRLHMYSVLPPLLLSLSPLWSVQSPIPEISVCMWGDSSEWWDNTGGKWAKLIHFAKSAKSNANVRDATKNVPLKPAEKLPCCNVLL